MAWMHALIEKRGLTMDVITKRGRSLLTISNALTDTLWACRFSTAQERPDGR